ncbi:nickel pincer cofactor biosynthesis protein LarC [Clostridium sp.]|jgi:uncharacterized protein (TIGR00299 family) protein|uniref:nickel pincer cofactor biosynthesis protein LarC n=1 Tax=Clostridium sp. TaxID=1506 RepID=UPI00258A8BC1|nr:nickel pincer cofactor biosynthesis protein LarC [Clostridium sp.]MDF2504370.1 hypothetical protein [Clostridium sp.]
MKILYYDCFSGISGDMNLGAMIDIGVPKDYLIDELKKLKLEGYLVKISKDMRKGITGTKVDVLLEDENATIREEEHNHHENNHIHVHDDENNDEHGLDSHCHDDHKHEHEDMHGHTHIHRGLKEIEDIINGSSLKSEVKKISMNIFMEVAKAEAKVHNKPLYEVHFHEVGAVDSIIDTVGAAICLDYLKVDKVICSDIELGGGFVKCAHGLIPVPAPAVVEILKDIPVKSGAVQFETTTPTGAAILKAVVDDYTNNKQFKIKKIGYGIGNRDTEIPNVLRVFLAERKDSAKCDLEKERAYVLECNIDDMNPENYDYIMERLFSIGASDVFLTPIIMKKGRPAVKLSVLCSDDKFKLIETFILCETTTLGFRKYEVEKTMLKRDFSKISTKFGDITIKNAYYNGEKIKSKPEYSECKKLACENGIPIKEIYMEIKDQL